MSDALVQLTTLIGLVVFGVLLAGLWNMGRQGTSPNLSQKLMRWRVGLQFVAVVVAMVTLAMTRG